jgi:hypothetical protein
MSRAHPQAATETMIPRGIYFGRPIREQPTDEAEDFIRCPACGGWIDCRDLGQVFEHEAPLPHPAQDQPQ